MISSRSPTFCHKFPGIIWQIKLDANRTILVAEVRAEVDQKVTYYEVNLKTFSLTKTILPASIGWWSALVAFSGDSYFVNKMESKSNPGPGTLVEFDRVSRTIKAEIPKFNIQSIEQRGILGETTDELGNKKSLRIAFSENEEFKEGWMRIPEWFQSGEEHFNLVAEYLSGLDIRPEIGVDYLEIENQLIISFYQKNEKKGFDRYIHWTDGDQVILQQKIDEGMAGIAPESFLTTENYLIFVSDRDTLNIYAL